MLLTRRTDYALVALAGLARRPTSYLSARDLADQLQLPLPILRNILKLLASRGLLISTRGPSGGYRLAREADSIRLGDVVEIVEGPMQLLPCCPVVDGEEPGCRLEDSCQIKGRIRQVHDRLARVLEEVTLEEIATDRPERSTMLRLVPAPID